MLAFKRKSFPDLFPEEVEILSGNKDEKYLNQKLELAFRFLDIKQERFRNIHRKELKINHLIYHFIVFEFSILDPNNLTLAQYAFNIIKNSSIIAEHQDQYGPYSVGLWDLDIRSSFTPEKEEFKVSSMEQSFMFFRKKIVGLSQDLLVSC